MLAVTTTLFEQAFINAPIGMALVDLQGCCIKVNPALCNMLGYSENELHSMNFSEFTHPDDLHKDLEYLELVHQGKIVDSMYEKRYYHKDGHILSILITLSAVKDAGGSIQFIIAQIQDVTELKQLQDTIFRDRELYRIIIKSSLDIISEHSIDGKYQYISDSCFSNLGYHPTELIDHTGFEFFHPEDNERMKLLHNKILTTTDPELITFRFRHKMGHYIWLESSVCSFRDQEGNTKGVLCISRDISYRKESERLMIQSEKLSIAGQLAAGIAHEIRNPLTSLKGFLQLLKNNEYKDYYFDVMSSELNRIELILSELLVLSKPQAQKKHRVDLVKLVQDVYTLMHSEANMHNVDIKLNFPSDAVYFMCDDNQLKQIIINFIKNAIDAMSNSGGELLINIEQTTTNIIIYISDNGPGISEEKLPLLGQPFYSTKEEGTGLGLMVSFKIIKDHNGSVSVSSELNRGTTFVIKFPRE